MPLPNQPLVPLKEGGGNAFLYRGVYESYDIGWSGGSEVDVLRKQDSGVAATEGVDFGAGEIVPVVGLWWDE